MVHGKNEFLMEKFKYQLFGRVVILCIKTSNISVLLDLQSQQKEVGL